MSLKKSILDFVPKLDVSALVDVYVLIVLKIYSAQYNIALSARKKWGERICEQ